MQKSYKEQLSEHVEKIFKSYINTGLHICDIATGGGKSYTIGKLTCQYYPQHFEKIIILCVQTKLVKSLNGEIEEFINGNDSLISPDKKMVIENNIDVITAAVNNNSFKCLLEDIGHAIEELKCDNQKVNELIYSYNKIKKIYEGIAGLVKTQDSVKNDYLNCEIEKAEASLRNSVRSFFDTYKRHMERTKKKKQILLSDILRQFPNLSNVYPQVEYKNKHVLLMTVHKAMYGIDPILSEKIKLSDFTDKNQRTLILFDESDQAATAIRNIIIDQAAEDSGGNRRFAKGYNGYLQYLSLISSPEHVSTNYYGNNLEKMLITAKTKVEKRWKKETGNIEPFKNIFLDTDEDLETYRRGVFFSGPAFKLNISSLSGNKNKSKSFICNKNGNRHFSLVHTDSKEKLQKLHGNAIPMDRFLFLATSSITIIKSCLRKIITDALQKSREKFSKEIDNLLNNKRTQNYYLGWPTLEREIHTLLSRFETSSEYLFEQEINEFIKNRKNIIFNKNGKELKLPDYSVYTQGVQLFLEEIDERDNLHRVRLSCREIRNTPEKIIIDLVNSGNSSIVLCSATASNGSVVSNCDIKYLKQVLGSKVHTLTTEQMRIFDELSNATYPEGHQVKVIPIECTLLEAANPKQSVLPDRYKDMFSDKAKQDGSVDKWFKYTRRFLDSSTKDMKEFSFQFYRLLQFVETYHHFIKNPDIHSMIFFQNRMGNKDSNQYNIIASLVDGSYDEPFEDELPADWKNEHLEFTKDWNEVESRILRKLEEDKDAKLMLISAYGSFKAGANMQYEIPEGLENCISGDYWDNGNTQKKDWDAIFLQSPTNYLTMGEDGIEATFEKGLYNAMLILMMLNERGWLSPTEVNHWLSCALSGTFYFSEKNSPGIAKDKAAWAQAVVEQAVGRLCRTRNKPHTTCIMYDKSISKYFYKENLQKSLTKEFKELAEYILKNKDSSTEDISAEKQKLCNDANRAQRLLNRMRQIALKYTPHPEQTYDYLNEDDSDDENGEVSYQVKSHQIMNQSYKQTIIRKPVINSLDELDDEDKCLTFISTCYGAWERGEDNVLYFNYDRQKHRYTANGRSCTIKPSSVRLDILMKNDIIRQHFEKNGYATDWGPGTFILHPQILACDYAGEIGEEAFKAIVLNCNPNLTEENFKHLEGKDYELADFVLCDSNGKNRIAFDVKNMRGDISYDDQSGDIPTSQKRKIKEERLGCPLITVNILQRKDEGIDALQEIGGVIDENGDLISSAVEQIRKYVTIE